MLIKDIMTKKVKTIPSNTSIGKAKKIMKESKLRRLPVVDKGKLVGIATEERLDRITPATGAPVLWQITYLLSRTTVGDIMHRNPVTVTPDATVEQAVILAQSKRVGALVVIDNEKVVGIVTTNDFFYNIVNPTLGLGEHGVRILIPGAGEGKSTEAILNVVNKLNVEIKVIWAITSKITSGKDLTIHLDTEDAGKVINALKKAGYEATIVAR